jgi:hypothetical protein
MRVAVVATGIDDEAIIAQQTIVQPPRRAGEAPSPRRFTIDDQAGAFASVADPYEEERPSFAVQEAAPGHERSKGGGFNLFGWMRPGAPVAPSGAPAPAAGPPAAALEEEPPQDPELDQELEIPAFLRRQMTQR